MTLGHDDKVAAFEAREGLVRSTLDLRRRLGAGLGLSMTAPCRAIELVFDTLEVDASRLGRLANAPTVAEAVRRLGRRRSVLGRPVDLVGSWWRRNGEVTIVNHRTLGPCTLVPRGSRWWGRVATADGGVSEVTVDAAFAADCESRAYEFLRIPPPGGVGILQLLRLSTRGRWGDILARIGAGIVSALIALVLPIATALLIDRVIPDGEGSAVAGIGLALFVASGATALLSLIGGLSTLRFDNTVSYRAESITLSHVIGRFRRPDGKSDGEVIQRISAVNSAMGTVTHATDKVVVQTIRGFAHLGLLLYYSWVLAAVALGMLAIGLLVILVEVVIQNRLVRGSQEAAGRAQSLSISILDGLQSIRDREIGESALLRWAQESTTQTNLGYLSGTLVNVRTYVLSILGAAASLTVYFLAVWQYTGELTAGEFVASTLAMAAVVAALGNSAGVLGAVAVVAPVFERLRPLLETEDRADRGADAPRCERPTFAFEAVTARDTDWGASDVTDCSFSLESGSLTVVAAERAVTARVFMEVMLGLRTPDEGRVLVDGRSMLGIDSSVLRNLATVLVETPHVLPASIRTNLDPDGKVDDPTLDAAMAQTGLDRVISQLPLGLNTILDARSTGPVLTMRLAATRCLLHPGAFVAAIEHPVLANTEWGQAFLDDLAGRDTTRVLAGTRPELLARADRVLVFDGGGSLVADGPPEELRSRRESLPDFIAGAWS